VHTRRLRTASIVLIVVVAAGCSDGSKRSTPRSTAPAVLQQRAIDFCRARVTDPDALVSSEPTTVGEIRKVTGVRSFPTLSRADFGVWCWTRSGGLYTIYKAAGAEVISVAQLPVAGLDVTLAHGGIGDSS
jgi:hypothetical protein